jgi:hypothetical protein
LTFRPAESPSIAEPQPSPTISKTPKNQPNPFYPNPPQYNINIYINIGDNKNSNVNQHIKSITFLSINNTHYIHFADSPHSSPVLDWDIAEVVAVVMEHFSSEDNSSPYP